MLGSKDPKVLATFWEKVLGKPADMVQDNWYGWSVGNCFLSMGAHSEVKDKSQEPQRIMFNFETSEVQQEFERIRALGATVVSEPYQMGEAWIATLSDLDGNYFQLMTPWEK